MICMLAAVALTACELDYAPENTYVDEKVYKEEKTAQAALMGAYVRFNVFLSGAPQDQNNYANNPYTWLCGDLTTENLTLQENITSLNCLLTSEFSSSDHSGLLYSVWRWGYNAIDYTNNIIRGIEKYGRFDEKMEKQFVAEARFLRAYEYLQMLALFGDQALLGNDKGDGLVLQMLPYNGYDPEKPSPRSNNAEVWKLIISDLEQAIEDLPTTVPAVNARNRATKAVAQALLSRVYLWKGTYTNNREELTLAANYARQALQSGYKFSPLSTEYETNLFPSNEYTQADGYPDPTSYSEEVMLAEPSRIYTANYPNGLAYYAKKSYYIPATMLDLYDENDVRRSYLISHGSPNDNISLWTSEKYTGGQYDDVIYIRLSEVKLTLAEALARTSGNISEEALSQLNDIHQRAYPENEKPALFTPSDFASQDDFIKTILTERRKELAHESQYRYDLMRTGNALGDTVLGAIDPSRWNLPVPEYELRLTDGLIKQNTGYNE